MFFKNGYLKNNRSFCYNGLSIYVFHSKGSFLFTALEMVCSWRFFAVRGTATSLQLLGQNRLCVDIAEPTRLIHLGRNKRAIKKRGALLGTPLLDLDLRLGVVRSVVWRRSDAKS
jgi:hypothetical protein